MVLLLLLFGFAPVTGSCRLTLVSMTAVVAGVYEERPSQEDTHRHRLLLLLLRR